VRRSVKQAAPRKTAASRRTSWPVLLGLIGFAFLLYGNTIPHGYVLDDEMVTTGNTLVQRGVAGIPKMFATSYLYGYTLETEGSYRPLPLVSLAVERQLWGNNPHAHHLFNVVSYAATGVLLWLCLRRMLPRLSDTVPLAITLLWLGHPVHTEVVANIKSRDELLSFYFSVMSLLLTFRHHDRGGRRDRWLGVGAFFLALLSKDSALTFVAAIPLALYVFTDIRLKPLAQRVAPYAAAAVLYLVIRAAVLGGVGLGAPMEVINNSLVAIPSAAERWATWLVIAGRYLGLLVFPHPLSWDYSYNEIPAAGFGNPWVIVSALGIAAFAAYGVVHVGRRDPLAFGVLYGFVTMALTANVFVPVGATMAERFLYAPSLGFVIAIVFAALRLARLDLARGRPLPRSPLVPIFAVVLVVYTAKTIHRNRDWADNFSLFSAGVTAAPHSAKTHESLAFEYLQRAMAAATPARKQQEFDRSIAEFRAALAILPGYGEAWYNLGMAYHAKGDPTNEIAAYRKAIAVDPKQAGAYNNLGMYYLIRHEYDEAAGWFTKAIEQRRGSTEALGNLGICRFNVGRYAEAESLFMRSLTVDPNQPRVRENLDMARAALGRK
jgi:Tfp pilus assembly protein PilF